MIVRRTIQLLDHEILVEFSDPGSWADDGMGRCSIKNGSITVNKGLPRDVMSSTFMHELVHMIADMNSIELTEESIDGLALGFTSFIKNNPKFIAELLGGTYGK